jgi:hypothetical protein
MFYWQPAIHDLKNQGKSTDSTSNAADIYRSASLIREKQVVRFTQLPTGLSAMQKAWLTQ